MVVAQSYARIFFRNCVSTWVPVGQACWPELSAGIDLELTKVFAGVSCILARRRSASVTCCRQVPRFPVNMTCRAQRLKPASISTDEQHSWAEG